MNRRRDARRLALAAAVAGFACATDQTVGPGPLTSLGVDPAIALVAVGDSLQVTSWGVDEHNIPFVGLPTDWTTSDSTVATVSPSGLVQAEGIGFATITAAAEGFTAATSLTVQPPPSIVLSSDSVAFTAIAGGPDPAPDSVLITNGGGTALDSLTVDAVTYGTGATGWLVPTLSSTTSPSTLGLEVSAAGLATGTYSAIVTVGSVEATNSPQTVTVTLTVGVAAPALVVAAAGDSQQAPVNTAVLVDPAVRVTDQFGNPLAGIEVAFAVSGGGGTLTDATDTTDASGVAAVGSWILGTAVGDNTLTATAAALPGSPVTFTAVAVAGPAAQIAVLAGDSQTAPVGAPVLTVPAVVVRDQFGNLAAGAGVSFAVTGGGGSVTGGAATANPVGVAAVGSWTLGTVAGPNQLTATITGTATSVAFAATGVPDAAASIAAVAGGGQTAPGGSDVPTPPAVRVTDAFGNAVGGAIVTFAVAAGGGSVTGAMDTTDAAGNATVGSWTLGTTTGANVLTATAPGLSGSPVTFTATATAGAATQITLGAGNGQSATVNTAVAVAPAVLVRDQFNNPVPGVEITFAVAAGGGSVTGATDTTDALGHAAVGSWTLGTAAGHNTLQAAAPGLTGSPVTFTATGTPGAATTISLAAGSGQTAAAGTAVAIAPATRVTDQFGNGVPGVSVSFAVTGGGGSVTGGNATTGPTGIAAVSMWTLGTVPGPNTLAASSAGLTGSPVLFTATGAAGAASQVASLAGDGQTATVGTAVAVAPAVRVTDQFGNGVPGFVVTFTPTNGGSVTAATDTTDAGGVAAVGSWTLGTTAGPNGLLASANGLAGSPVTFTATGSAGSAAQIAASAGDGQSATVGTAVTTPPTVVVRDQFGNPVAGAVVTFAITGGGGATTDETDTTDVNGIGRVGSWTLGTTAGPNTLTATSTGLTGSPVTFTATGTAAGATQIALQAGNGQSATVNSAVATPPAVVVRDQFNNPVAGASVTFAVTGGGGSFTGTNPATTNASGIAAVGSWTLGVAPGPNTLTAAAAGLSGSPVVFAAAGLAGAGTQIAAQAGDGQVAGAGTAVAIAPAVIVRDQFGNPVPGVEVAFAVTGGGGTTTDATDTTDAAGVATVGTWTLGNVAGTNTLDATSAGLSGSPVTFTATATSGAAAALDITAGNAQTDTVDQAVPIAPAVTARDAFGNPVPGVVVTFTITGGGGSVTGATDTTDATGVAAVGSWTLGTTAGLNTLQAAAVGAAPVSFTAAGTPDVAATIAAHAGDGQTATVNTAVAVPPAVLVTDQFGNPVSSVPVTFTVTGGGGSVGGGTPATRTAGSAAVGSWTLGTTAGVNTLEAAASGLAGSPVVFTATGTADAATQLALNLGNNQTATVNTAVATAPSVVVRDQFLNPVAGVTVTFAVTGGAGSVTDETDTTDATGVAAVGTWTLGTAAGTNNNTLTAASGGLTGSPVTFTASATAGAAAQIAAFAGEGQSAQVGTAVPTAPAVIVSDQFGNPAGAGVIVTFAVTGGGGNVTNATDTTDASGVAAVGAWTLGPTAGPNTLTATSTPSLTGSPVTFTATAFAGAAATMALDAGDAQTDTVGATLAIAYAVLLTDSLGNPVSGIPVAWAVTGGGGTITPVSMTDGSGIAVAMRVLGHTAGPQTAVAAVGGLTGSPVPFTATATPGSATQISLSAGNNQSATVNTDVPVDAAVVVRDQFNNPVAGVSVTFAVTGGGGSVTGPTDATDATGVAAVGSWTLGTTAGANTLQATSPGLTGSPVVFAATGTAGPVTQLTPSAGDGQTATVVTAVAIDPAVLLRDQFNNPVAGAAVTFTPAAGGGSVTGSPALSNASGIATVGGWIMDTSAGTQTLQATSGGQPPVNFTATATPAAASQIAVSAGNAQTATVNTAVAIDPAVVVRDEFNNPVAGVVVVFAVTGGGGSVTGAPSVIDTTDASGVATVGAWTLGTGAGANNNTLRATAAGLTPVTFSASATAGPATQLAIQAGNGQFATVNTAVAVDPAVVVRDQFNNRVAGVVVAFAVTGGGGNVTGATDTTDASGVAAVGSWTLGTAAGIANNTLQATATGLTPITFLASATAGAPTQMAVNAGDAQSATVNSTVAIAPSVLVRDQFSNAVPTVSVAFAVTGGGGSVSGSPATTNASGMATLGSWTLGTTAGANTLEATATGPGPVSFTATGTAGAASQIAISAGDGQTATVNTAVAIDPAAIVRDPFGNPVAGAIVTFAVTAGGGVATGTTDTSDAGGVATVGSWTLGPATGTNNNTLRATVGAFAPANFSASATAAPATQLTIHTGNGQSATVNTAVATDPAVLLRDAFNNPVAGVVVTFAVTGGGGSVTGGTDTTDASGVASVGSWTLGTVVGSNNNTLQASAGVLVPVSFSASATAGPATQLTIQAGNNQSATVNTTVAIDPAVLLRDQFNNPVPGVIVTFAVTAGGGSVTGATDATDANGVATVGAWTLGTVVGADNNALQAGAGGLVPVTFMASATAGAATQLTIQAGNNQSATVNTAVATGPAVLVSDAFGNGIAGVGVKFTITSGGGSLTGDSVQSGAGGVATLGTWTLGRTAGANTLHAASAGLTGSPVAFTATGTADAATQMIIVAGNGQSDTVNSAVAIAPAVRLRDQFNNDVPGVVVTFAVTSGGGSVTGGTDATDAGGVAAVGSWTLGTVAGTNNNTLEATAGALSRSFDASAEAGPVSASRSLVGISDNPILACRVLCSEAANTATAITVTARDQFDNAVRGATVTVASTGTGHTLSPAPPRNTGADGTSQVTLTDTVAQVQTISATAGGVAIAQSQNLIVSPAEADRNTSSLVANDSSITACAVACTPGPANTAATITATIRDAFNNVIPLAIVTFDANGQGNTFDPSDTDTTNASGVAQRNFHSTRTQNKRITASVDGGLIDLREIVRVDVNAAAANSVLISAGDSQAVRVGAPVGTDPSVLVRDEFLNPVVGQTVAFSILEGGGVLSGASPVTDTNGIARVTSWRLGAAGTEGAEGSGALAGQFGNRLRATVAGVLTVEFTARGFYAFNQDVLPILSGCDGCHYNNGAYRFSHQATFNVAQQDPLGFTACTLANSAGKLIEPGSATQSLIYLKTNGAADPDPSAHPCPAPSVVMPSGAGLPPAQRTILRAWINAGALNN